MQTTAGGKTGDKFHKGKTTTKSDTYSGLSTSCRTHDTIVPSELVDCHDVIQGGRSVEDRNCVSDGSGEMSRRAYTMTASGASEAYGGGVGA